MLLKNIKNKEALQYAERYVNQFKKVANEVSPKYCAMQGVSSFFVPYSLLPIKKVKIYLANPKKNILNKVIKNGAVRFFVHPDMIDELTQNDPYISALYWKIRGAPTSSTRTIILKGKNFAIKLHLNKRLSKYIRRLRANSVRHSIFMSSEIEKALKKCPSTFGYLPESIGITYRNFGMIVREMTPRPHIKEKRFLIPLFSLYSLDLKNANDGPLFAQIIKSKKKNALEYFIEKIVRPLFLNMTFFINNYGILLEPHGQNVLVELDSNFEIKRLVHRDFQSMYIDQEIRKRKGLPRIFNKHIMGRECPKEVSYSLVYDQYVGEYMFKNFVELLHNIFKIPREKTRKRIKKEFEKHFTRNLFPSDGYYLMKKGEFKDNDTMFVKYNKKPKYRP